MLFRSQIPAVGGGTRIALWGFSQGAHAVLFAAAIASTYSPELSLVGVAAVAPPTDLRSLLYADIETVPGRILVAMTLWSWSTKYGAPLAGLIDDEVSEVVREVASNCVDDLGGKLGAFASQRPLKKRFLSADPGRVSPWREILASNSIFKLPAGAIAFIAQGDLDTIVRPETTRRFVIRSCQSGNKVNYAVIKGADHEHSASRAINSAMT